MSVYIKGFPLPNNCGACPLRLAWCRERIYMVTRPERCPLVPVPPHGRLIDETHLNMLIHTAKEIHANEKHDFCNAFDSNGQVCTEWWCVEDMIENAPTIIPADKEVEG